MIPPSLLHAVTQGDSKEVGRLLEQLPANKYSSIVNAPVDRQGERLLHLAARRGDAATIQVLLSFHADPNATDNRMRTPLAVLPQGQTSAEAHQVLILRGAIDDPDYFTKAQPNIDDNETRFIDKTLMRRAFRAFLVPFVILMVYNGFVFCLVFGSLTVTFYLVVAAFFVSQITVKPPWYHPSPRASRLSLAGLPAEWRGLVHDPATDLGISFVDVEFTNRRSKKTLRGWFVPAPSSSSPDGRDTKRNVAVVFVHGGGRDRRTWLRHLPMFHKAGYACLLWDMQEHGCSDGDRQGLTFGVKERYDVLCAVDFMRVKSGLPHVALVGTSMGASASIMAAAIDTQHNISMIIAENPLLSAARLQRHHLKNMFMPYFGHTRWSTLVFRVFVALCTTFLNVRIGNVPSKRCQAHHVIAKLSERPLLLMHGTYDKIVSMDDSMHLFNAAQEPKELWLLPGAAHVCLYDTAPAEYEKRVLRFLEKYAPPSPSL